MIYGIFGGAGKPSDVALTRKDLETPTAYNTYVIPALPPGPIANPGRASLEAVANPSRTRDLYFVADGSGGHAFAQSYEEHLRNVARWRDYNASKAAADEAGTPPTATAARRRSPFSRPRGRPPSSSNLAPVALEQAPADGSYASCAPTGRGRPILTGTGRRCHFAA